MLIYFVAIPLLFLALFTVHNRLSLALTHYETYQRSSMNFFTLMREVGPTFRIISSAVLSLMSWFHSEKLESGNSLKNVCWTQNSANSSLAIISDLTRQVAIRVLLFMGPSATPLRMRLSNTGGFVPTGLPNCLVQSITRSAQVKLMAKSLSRYRHSINPDPKQRLAFPNTFSIICFLPLREKARMRGDFNCLTKKK